MQATLCPLHGSALCPEDYMLDSDGHPWSVYRDAWTEDMRCGQRPPSESEQLRRAFVDAELLEDRIHTLVAALERYGHHEAFCTALGGGKPEDCDCGLGDALEPA